MLGKISSIISLLVAIAITGTGFLQWYAVTSDGKPKLAKWALWFLIGCLIALGVALVFCIMAPSATPPAPPQPPG